MSNAPHTEILCVGELLWDALPAGLFLGGAPFNVACHLRAAGLPVAIVTRVGADQLGAEALRRAARLGLATDLVQVDPALPTGFVQVAVDAAGGASFAIAAPAAWDAVEPTAALLERAARARAVVWGTLAQRDARTRDAIERVCEAARGAGALLVFAANLRAPYDDRAAVLRSLRRAAVVKVTAGELDRCAGWFRLPTTGGVRGTAEALARAFGCRTVCVTRGRDGAALWHEGLWVEHPGFDVEVRDTVGAGDAFLAVLLAGLLGGADPRTLLQHASLMGAYVATQPGALPADQPAPEAPPRPR